MCRSQWFAIILVLSIAATQAYVHGDVSKNENEEESGRREGPIVGGRDTDIQKYPHQISMRYNGRHRCGGSLYTANIVVSASHCVINTNASALSIVAGSTLLSEKNVEIPVLKYIMHEQYESSLQDYDVCILVLKGLFPFNEFIQPIALAKERPPDGTEITVTGWGAMVEGGAAAEHLQEVNVFLVSVSSCKKSYPLMTTDRMLCASVPGGGKDACQGDSGGPLIYNNELLGVVSWGIGCAKRLFPGVYASVPNLYEWIEKTAARSEISFA